MDLRYLEEAIRLADVLRDDFADDEDGGFFVTSDRSEELVVRPKDGTDTALPSGNSLALSGLLRLARITGEQRFEDTARRIPVAFGDAIASYPAAFTFMLLGIDFLSHPTYEVVVVGDPESADTRALLRELRSFYMPGMVVLLKDPAHATELTEVAPFTEYHSMIDGKATVYVCREFACELPTTDIRKMRELLGV
jgi:uncharacterized protein YyaL (SSP411 family)